MTPAPLHEALGAARALALRLPAEDVALGELMGRVLAADVAARCNLPAANCSAMDGWAVCAADLPGQLTVVGESRAGAPWSGTLAGGQAVRISTGALVPDGADTILRLEEGEDDGWVVRATATPGMGRDIRFAAEDLRQGRVVLAAGTRIGARHVGIVAAAGHAAVPCHARARVAIVATGSELVAPGGPVSHGTVFDSNRYALAAQVEDAGAVVASAVNVADEPGTTLDVARAAVEGHDMVVVAGGLSVGRHDHVRAALDELGLQAAFTRMAMRPGRPTTLGTVGDTRVLAVPGNPAAASVAMHLLGRPLLGAEEPWSSMPLAAAVDTAPSLDLVVRCRDDDGRAAPLPQQGSGLVSSIAGADLLAWIPPGDDPLAPGTPVRVSRL